ncbi:MAG: hypothetical protein HW392_338 [Steroidobacteraceae bacterium]|nr:hypothetical protein [Steroidobacteraceae bacterium]
MMQLPRSLVLWFAFACLAVLTVIYAPLAIQIANRGLHWGLAESQTDIAQINIGDRIAEVEFSEPFPSPPIVTATARTMLGSLSFAVVRTDAKGFRLELSEPAPHAIEFAWNAMWNIWAEVDDIEDRGLPGRLTAKTADGKSFEPHVEAYQDDRPAVLLVPADQLKDLRGSDEEIASAALEAARRSFADSFSCSWLDRLRQHMRARVTECPAWGDAAERANWRRVDLTLWSIARIPRGLEIVLKDGVKSPVQWEDTVKQWAELMRGSEANDLFPHNNQVLDFLDALIADRKLAAGDKLTIIHFDTHSDLWIYPDPFAYALNQDISDFLNTVVLKAVVAEIYWVLPDWTREERYVKTFWSDKLPDEAQPYAEGPRTLPIFVDRNADALYFGSPPQAAPDLPAVRYHKVLLRELPDFTGRDNIYLEIDGDYFSNTGFDTNLQGRLNPDRGQMLAAFATAATTLVRLGVKPRFTSWSLSPDYTAPEDELDQELFFLSVLDRLPAKDYLSAYAHSEPSRGSTRTHNVRRQSTLEYYLLELEYQDIVESNGDRQVDLGSKGNELGLAERLAARRLGLSADQIPILLRRLDRFDGISDGWIKLRDLEYFSAVTDVNQLLPGPSASRSPP